MEQNITGQQANAKGNNTPIHHVVWRQTWFITAIRTVTVVIIDVFKLDRCRAVKTYKGVGERIQ